MNQNVGNICPVCKTVILPNENVKMCRTCGVAHHADCWDKNNGCATPGCPGGRTVQAAPAKLCKVCGAELKPGMPVCVKCGALITGDEPLAAPAPQAAPAPAAQPVMGAPTYAPGAVPGAVQAAPAFTPVPAAPAKPKKPIFPCILGMISGLLSIVMGIVCFCMNTGSGYSFETYGGDAYTGIQHAAAQTARNTAYMADIVKVGLSGLLVAVGLALLAFFIAKLMESSNASKA